MTAPPPAAAGELADDDCEVVEEEVQPPRSAAIKLVATRPARARKSITKPP
jgi:hypothetical protein